MERTHLILGLDVGGTKTAAVLGDPDGRIRRRASFLTRTQRGFQPVFDELCSVAASLLARAVEEQAPVDALSVSIGGPLDIGRGIIKSPPNLPGWDDIPLKQLLADRFHLPVFIEHDGNAGALAEWLFGAARGARNVIFLTMGTGFGGGLILNGQLYPGTCDLAGEVGHLRLADDGPLAFGKTGSWEGLCGGAGIARRAARRFPRRWQEGSIAVKELADLAAAGDRDVLALFEEVGRDLGRGLALLIDILNPEIIVIGSLAVRLGDWVLQPAREVICREALPAAAAACRLVPAALGERLGDVAALCAALYHRQSSRVRGSAAPTSE
jgi:glucokinase